MFALAVAGALALAAPARAQQSPLPRAELPEFTARAEASVLPALVLPARDGTSGLAAGLRLFVREYEVVGSTVLSEPEIAELIRPYAGRPVSYSDLQALRDQLTQAYVSRGYVTSGAVLPEQSLREGRVRIEIEEGALDEIRVETDGRLRPRFIEKLVRAGAHGPLNVFELEARLQLLQQDPRIRAVRASLASGGRRGEGRLAIALEERRAFSGRLEVDNGLAPSVGSERAALELEHLNVSGVGDALSLRLGRSRGLREIGARYDVPLGARDTRLELSVRSSASEVVEAPFDALDIESRSATYAIRLRHPVYATASRRLELGLSGEYRRSKSFLLGSPFSFTAGVEDGESTLCVARFSQDWSAASLTQVLSVRSTFSLGLGALGATTSHAAAIPDGRFLAWLAQLQYARRFAWLNAQLIARADLQLANDPLLGLEQFSVGGRTSVRGYRENELVRDQGAVGSLELRIPVWRRRDGFAALELAPFFDVGRSWSRRTPTPALRTLASAGLGTRLSLGSLDLDVYWAEALRDVPDEARERDLQDAGIQLRITQRF